MSPSLQSEVLLLAHGKWLQHISFLRDAPKPFMAELSTMIDAQVSSATRVLPVYPSSTLLS